MGIEQAGGSSSAVLEIVEAIQDLPMLPAAVGRVIALANDPDSSSKDICEAIRSDPSLTARILRVVNTPFYGFHRRIGTVAQAAVILGTSEILGLVLGSTAVQALTAGDQNPAEREEFWIHSVSSAVAAKTAATQFRYRVSGIAFVAGLLHDSGKLVLSQRFPDRFRQAEQRAAEAGVPLHAAEQEVFGVDHALVGGTLASRWGLPEELVQAIAFHHTPARAAEAHALLVDVVHLANWLAWQKDRGVAADSSPAPLDDVARTRLYAVRVDFDASYLDKMLHDLDREMEHCGNLLAALGGKVHAAAS